MSTKTVILFDPAFPHEPGLAAAAEELRGAGYAVVDGARLAETLRGVAAGWCFVNLHAPYFPKSAWSEIVAFLERGGGLVSIGGAPFQVPMVGRDGGWEAETAQTSYHQQLGIHEAMPVDIRPVERLAASDEIPLFAGHLGGLTVEPTFSFILHVTRHNDQPAESGSAGPMDARIYALVKGVSKEGREVAAPVVLLENAKGSFAGGRWLFVNQRLTDEFWLHGGAKALAEWAEFCACGVTEMWLKPNCACLEPGEQPRLQVTLQRIQTREDAAEGGNGSWTFKLSFAKRSEDGVSAPLWETSFVLPESREYAVKPISVPVALEAGLYEVELTAVSERGEVRKLRQGIWGMDRELLSRGEPLTAGRDYFRRNGKPVPIVGMTYMTSDVARKFVFLPNVSVWDRDMSAMKNAGINLIRTGFWTAYRQVMYADGHPSEEVLRAIDAFVLTAKRHELEVTFNFFAFAPEAWEGSNPYLDPRSVEAQKRLIAAIVSRHRDSVNVHWDLINEPSMFDPQRIFGYGPRSARDACEQKAFVQWLKERHESLDELQERWGMSSAQLPAWEAVEPPEPDEINFDVQDMLFAKKGVRWLDYTLFSMDMLNRWSRQLSDTIRHHAPNRLITIGQDEALGARRPSPFFFESSVDYTTNHSWWLMDDLVWDGIFAKTPYKPNLIQETGIMYVETPDGRAKRSETELRNILERKYAYAFSTGGAGAVQWLWNTNYFMHNVNESNIGALRADGTEKPEADVSYDFGRFIASISDLFEGRELEDIVVVYPYSNDFSNRPLAFESTTRLTRMLSYELKVPFRAMGEYELGALEKWPPKLIVVPSAHNFSGRAFERLVDFVTLSGGTLLVTGPIGLNEYWQRDERLTALTGSRSVANVLREEALQIGEKTLPLAFGGRKIAQLCKEVPTEAGGGGVEPVTSKGPVPLVEISLGEGKLLWCGLPVELNDRSESTAAFYRHVLADCGVRPELEWLKGGDLPGVYGRKLAFRDGALYIFVSEYACDAEIAFRNPDTGKHYAFTLESERTVMFAADRDGRLVAVYRPEEVAVAVK